MVVTAAVPVTGIAGTFCSPLVLEPLTEALATDGLELRAVDWMNAPGPWDLAAVAARIADDLRRSDAPAVVVGHSTGGAIALQLALDAPDVVTGLVLVDSGPNMHEHGDVDAILRTIRDDWGDALLTAVLDRSFASPLEPDVRQALLAYARGVPPQAALDVLASQRATDFVPRLAELRCPVAVVHGVHDPVRTPEQSRRFADQLPGASLTLLDCGHTPPYEAPAEVADVVRSLLVGREID